MKAAFVALAVLTLAIAAPAGAMDVPEPADASGPSSFDACTVDIGLVKVCGLCVIVGVNTLCLI